MNYRFYNVTLKNLSTEGFNEYFNRNRDVYENVILITTPENASNDLDQFLCDNCFCDGYEYTKCDPVPEKENEKLNNIYYELSELIDVVTPYDDNTNYNTEILYRLNSIWHELKN